MTYRIVTHLEDCAAGLCLSCQEQFTLLYDEEYKFCPKCGEVTEPVKANKRYTLPQPQNNYRLDNKGKICETFTPHFILETSKYTTVSLSTIAFAAVTHPPKRLPWVLHTHLAMGAMMLDCSASVWMVNRFDELVEKQSEFYDHVRLRLMDGTEWEVIRET